MEQEESKRIRPSHIKAKAHKEYEKVYAERLELFPGKYSKAVKAALRAYDKVLKDYDRTQKESTNSPNF